MSPSSGGVRVRALAPAKINLGLEIVGRRADGYHDLRTWMLAIDVQDELEVSARDDGRIHLHVGGSQATEDVRADATNLAFRAAEMCLGAARERGLAGPDRGLDLRLEKRIPSQSGLGGASADAAAAWIAARACVGPALPDEVGVEHLAQLGSDCVFFLKAFGTGFALCEGRGELVAPALLPGPLSIALVTPTVVCPTALVYASFAARARVHGRAPARWDGSAISLRELRARLGNDLEQAAIASVPELGAWRALLDACGADHFRLSGSGSSFFGLFEDDRGAQDVLACVRQGARARALGVRILDVVHAAGHGSELALDN